MEVEEMEIILAAKDRPLLFLHFAASTAVVGLRNDPCRCKTTTVRGKEGGTPHFVFSALSRNDKGVEKKMRVTFCCKFPFP